MIITPLQPDFIQCDDNSESLLNILSLPLIGLSPHTHPGQPVDQEEAILTFLHHIHSYDWITATGLPYAAVEADLQAFLEGFEVKAVQMPLAPANTKRAGETKGEQWVVDECVCSGRLVMPT